MKYIISLFIISYSLTSVLSQTPGYLGKKISIEGDVNLLPNITNFGLGNNYREVYNKENYYYSYYNPNTNSYEQIELYKYNSDHEEIKKKHNIRYTFKSSLTFNYTLSRKTDISIRLNKIYGNFLYKNESGTGTYNTLFFDENIKYQSSEIDLNFKLYKKNFIAPVGKYILLGIGLAKVKSNPNEIIGTLINSIYDHTTGRYNNSKEEIILNHKVSYLKINLGFGNKTIINSNLFLMYGIESNAYFIVNKGVQNSDNNYISIFKTNYNQSLSKNLLWDNIFCIKFGLGIIL